MKAPLRIPGAGRLEEGYARKVRYPDPDGDGMEELVLCRLGGRLYATDSLCPHEGGRISEGPLQEGKFLFCPLHLYKFDPVSGAAQDVVCPPVRTFRVDEIGVDAEVWLDVEPA